MLNSNNVKKQGNEKANEKLLEALVILFVLSTYSALFVKIIFF